MVSDWRLSDRPSRATPTPSPGLLARSLAAASLKGRQELHVALLELPADPPGYYVQDHVNTVSDANRYVTTGLTESVTDCLKCCHDLRQDADDNGEVDLPTADDDSAARLA